MLAFMIILIVLVMITATTGPVFVIASMGGDEAVPFGKVYSD
jgi:NADP-dependent 3-hydroxy acid dehydrogenase YdfG